MGTSENAKFQLYLYLNIESPNVLHYRAFYRIANFYRAKSIFALNSSWEMDSCNSAAGRIRGLHLAKKIYPARQPFSLLSLSFSLPYPKSPDLAALSSYRSPVKRKPHYTTPEKIGSTSCAPNAPRPATMDRVLHHYVAGGSHYWPIRSGALSARLSDFIARRAHGRTIFFPFGVRATRAGARDYRISPTAAPPSLPCAELQ